MQTLTLWAFLYAVRTDTLFTIGAQLGATVTNRLIATAAGAATFFTEALITKGAPVTILVIHNMPAVITGCAIPLIQPNVWTIRAVGIQDASYYGEKVT